MSQEKISFLAEAIAGLNASELLLLRKLLEDGDTGQTGVAAAIPPGLPPKEGAAFKEWPKEYWESQE